MYVCVDVRVFTVRSASRMHFGLNLIRRFIDSFVLTELHALLLSHRIESADWLPTSGIDTRVQRTTDRFSPIRSGAETFRFRYRREIEVVKSSVAKNWLNRLYERPTRSAALPFIRSIGGQQSTRTRMNRRRITPDSNRLAQS
jgi:hypothetical protein